VTAALLPRPAATLMLLRAGARGLETLMLQRTQNAAFLGGAYVFPGGALDPSDVAPRRVLGLTEAQANQRLGLASGGLGYYVAAVRECFEEAGVLLACDANGNPVLPARAEKLMAERASPFLELLERENLFIPAGALAYYGHWITQPGRSRRFDARFFVTLAPAGQEGAHDAVETVHHLWIEPRQALARGDRGEIELVHATRQTLADFARFAEPRAAFEYAMSLVEIPTNRACLAQGREGARIFRRGDAPYFEIHWSDPEESGQTSYDLVPGVAHMDDHDADAGECESFRVPSFLELFGTHGVEQARCFEHVPQSVIALLTGVLEYAGMIRTAAQIERHRPRRRPRRGIGERGLVRHRVLAGAREALHQLQ